MFAVAWLARKLGPVIAGLLAQLAREILRHPLAERERVARDLLRVAEMRGKSLAFDATMKKIPHA